MHTFSKFLGIILLSISIFSGCKENISDPGSVDSDQMSLSKGKVTHHVSVGGPDIILPPGSDANFSLVANMDASGNVSGQWQDTFGKDVNGNSIGKIHVDVDCLEILPPGNAAIIGGVIKHGSWFGVDVSGQRAVTKVVDNGKSANDPPDQISYSYFGTAYGTCGNYTVANFPLLDLTRGQVTVK
jgi:hypothetical protein